MTQITSKTRPTSPLGILIRGRDVHSVANTVSGRSRRLLVDSRRLGRDIGQDRLQDSVVRHLGALMKCRQINKLMTYTPGLSLTLNAGSCSHSTKPVLNVKYQGK